MTAPSHARMGAVDPCCPSDRAILRDSASQYLELAADDALEAGRRLRWLADGERQAHGIEAAGWLTTAQCDRLRRLAQLADLVAADARALLQEVA